MPRLFEITVVTPGRIIGTNVDAMSGKRATWKFSGQRFGDRDVELTVS